MSRLSTNLSPPPALLLLLGAHGIAVLFLLTPYLVDDAFIYLRIATHGASGVGFFFDPATQVNVASSPLFPVLLSVPLSLGLDDLLAMKGLHLLGILLLSGGLWRLFRPMGPNVGFAAALMPCIEPRCILSAGMETSVFLAATVWSIIRITEGRVVWSALLAVIAVSLRFDAAVLFPLSAWVTSRSYPRQVVGFLGASTIFATLGLWTYTLEFGLQLPQSVAAKIAFASLEHVEGRQWALSWISQIPLGWVTLPLAAWGLWTFRRDLSPGVPLFLAVIGAQLAVYSLSNAPSPFYWYFIPGNLGVLCLATLGISEVYQRQKRILLPSRAPRIVLAAIVIITSVALSLLPPYRFGPEYVAVARWLQDTTAKDSVIAVDEIGYLGHLAGRPILDMNALLHPEALPSIERREWWWWLDRNPSFVITHDPPRSNEPSPSRWPEEELRRFSEQYRVATRERGVVVWERIASTPAESTAQ